ncbi:AraC family transcriptional regulator [Zhongshania sp. BJYM1]|uniref:AraC family transcriptional regulator n=1 Tax=Zhongshania aquatica TaxID=2965069 RepID=UPI0022B48F08|nr:AraC family transcriptional regulator [Marortus sp. BJYM1]
MDNFDSLTISIATVNSSLAGPSSQGINVPALLRKCGVDPRLLNYPQARIPVQQFIQLCRLSSGQLNDEQYGLLEKPQRLGTYRAIAINVVHGKNLGEALKRYVDVSNLFENSFEFSLNTSHRRTELIITRRPAMKVANNFAVESALMIAHRFSSWLINERIALQGVYIDYPSPPFNEYNYLFYGAPVLSNQDHSAIAFDTAYLERPVVQNESELENYLQHAPAKLYLPLDESGQLSLQVRQMLSDLPNSLISNTALRDTSAMLGISSDTLRRRLKREGTNFQTIRANIRRELAIHYLASSTDTIESIAYKTGYTEPGAFIRAFKNWTGYTPLKFRKLLQN